MKIYFALILTFILTSCGSGEKKSSSSGSLSEMTDKQAESAVEEAPKKSEDEKKESKDKEAGAEEKTADLDAPPPGNAVKMQAGAEYKPLGSALFSGDETQVVHEASKFLAKNPKDLIALNAMAVHYYNRKKTDLAKLILAKALKIYPNSATVHNNLGLVYLRENKMVETVSEFRRALELDPNHPEAAANLGSLLVKTKNYPAAVTLLQKAYRVLDKDVPLANNFAVALMGVKKFADAEAVLNQAKAGDSNNPTLLLNYAILLVEHLKSKKPGLKIVNKIRFLSQDEAILRRAQVLADKAEAIK